MTKHSSKKLKTNIAEKKPGEGAYKNLEIQFDKAFRQAVRATQGKVSLKTHHRYRDSMKKILSFCARAYRLEKLTKISNKHVLAYIEYRRDQGRSEKTIKEDFTALRFFHNYVEGAKNTLIDNKAAGLKTTPDGRKDRAWREDEYQKMLDLSEKLNRKDVAMAMRLARYVGLRIHEVTRMTRGSAEEAIAKGQLHIKGKGGKERNIPLNDDAKAALREACGQVPKRDSKLLVGSGDKTHLVIKRIQNFIRNHREKVFIEDNRKVNITFHGLRHLYAREQYESMEKPRFLSKKYKFDRNAMQKVSELLGHGRREVTRIYLAR